MATEVATLGQKINGGGFWRGEGALGEEGFWERESLEGEAWGICPWGVICLCVGGG